MAKGTKRECMFTGMVFRPEKRGERLCPEAKEIVKEAVVEAFATDKQFRNNMITAMLSDDNVSITIARSLFSLKAKELGFTTSGSIADLFREQIREDSTEEA